MCPWKVLSAFILNRPMTSPQRVLVLTATMTPMTLNNSMRPLTSRLHIQVDRIKLWLSSSKPAGNETEWQLEISAKTF
jgi:hypothetical protein